jgi:hypothetical protein
MSKVIPSRAAYVITADAPEGVIQQTRYIATSAVILARRWIETGYVDVQVTDPRGAPLPPEMFQAKNVNRHRGV